MPTFTTSNVFNARDHLTKGCVTYDDPRNRVVHVRVGELDIVVPYEEAMRQGTQVVGRRMFADCVAKEHSGEATSNPDYCTPDCKVVEEKEKTSRTLCSHHLWK